MSATRCTATTHFNPRPLRGGRPRASRFCLMISNFNPRPPRGGRPRSAVNPGSSVDHFNPRPPRGGRHAQHRVSVRVSDFNPRPPEGGDFDCAGADCFTRYFNPRPPRGGRRGGWTQNYGYIVISIHAPREGGDIDLAQCCHSGCISIHAPARGATASRMPIRALLNNFNPRPREGGDVCQRRLQNCRLISIHAPARGATPVDPVTVGAALFQSTPPTRGATLRSRGSCPAARFQSTPPTRGATDNASFLRYADLSISIHAPREGGDQRPLGLLHVLNDFNPRPPEGGRRWRGASAYLCPYFNPRPPRGGRRSVPHALPVGRRNFNPRPPRGGRLFLFQLFFCFLCLFQSTPPTRGATSPAAGADRQDAISIHAPHEGGDGGRGQRPHLLEYFNPRPPRGGRLPVLFLFPHFTYISIHAPHEGGDTAPDGRVREKGNFNPRPPRGGRLVFDG